jgi:hypothetical protein
MTCSLHPQAAHDPQDGCLACWFRKPDVIGHEPMPDKKCVVCTEVFTPCYPNQKACSVKCKRQRAIDLGRHSESERRTCKLRECRNKFTPNCSTQKFCTDDCRKAWYKQDHYKAKWKRENKRGKRERLHSAALPAQVSTSA